MIERLAADAAFLAIAGVFAYAGLAKLLHNAGGRETIVAIGAPAPLAPWLAAALPATELALAVCLLAPAPLSTRAAWASAALFGLFAATIVRLLALGRRVDCNCFGGATKPLDMRALLRNLALIAVAAFAALQGQDFGDAVASAESFAAGAALVFAAAFAFGCWRELQRTARQAKARTAGAVMPRPAGAGLPIGAPAPEIALRDPAGAVVDLAVLLAPGRHVALVFVGADCVSCDSVAASVAERARDPHAPAIVMVAAGGPGSAQALRDEGGAAARAFGVWGAPEAVLIAPEGTIASPLAKGAGAIRDLLRAPLASPVAAPVLGRTAPDITGVDQRGAPFDIRTYRGREVLIVYWHSGCPHCQTLAQLLASFERAPPPWAPALVILSATPPALDAALDFDAPVISGFPQDAARALGFRGTPNGLLLDAEGRIASELAMGGAAILSLANGVAAG